MPPKKRKAAAGSKRAAAAAAPAEDGAPLAVSIGSAVLVTGDTYKLRDALKTVGVGINPIVTLEKQLLNMIVNLV